MTRRYVELVRRGYDWWSGSDHSMPRLIRNAWIDAPNAPPVDVSCLADIAAIDLGTGCSPSKYCEFRGHR